MKKLFLLLLVTINLIGCGSRYFIQDNAITPVANLYNRNFIVAAPTMVANLVCGTPFVLISAGLAAFTVKSEPSSEAYYDIINGIYFIPATICGSIVGAPFIPFSYVCPENPWYYGFDSYYREWSCSTPSKGPYIENKNMQIITTIVKDHVVALAEKDHYFDQSLINKYVTGLMKSIKQHDGTGVIIATDALRWCKFDFTLDNDKNIKNVEITSYQKDFGETFNQYKIDKSEWINLINKFNTYGHADIKTLEGNLIFKYNFKQDSFDITVTHRAENR